MGEGEKKFRLENPEFNYKRGNKVVLTPKGITMYNKYGLYGTMVIKNITFNNHCAYFYFESVPLGYSFKYFKKCRSDRIKKLLLEL